jgi:hypothetical protein
MTTQESRVNGTPVSHASIATTNQPDLNDQADRGCNEMGVPAPALERAGAELDADGTLLVVLRMSIPARRPPGPAPGTPAPIRQPKET